MNIKNTSKLQKNKKIATIKGEVLSQNIYNSWFWKGENHTYNSCKFKDSSQVGMEPVSSLFDNRLLMSSQQYNEFSQLVTKMQIFE